MLKEALFWVGTLFEHTLGKYLGTYYVGVSADDGFLFALSLENPAADRVVLTLH